MFVIFKKKSFTLNDHDVALVYHIELVFCCCLTMDWKFIKEPDWLFKKAGISVKTWFYFVKSSLRFLLNQRQVCFLKMTKSIFEHHSSTLMINQINMIHAIWHLQWKHRTKIIKYYDICQSINYIIIIIQT